MGVEIERKFLVRGDAWKSLGEPVFFRQGYLSSHKERVVRVRIEGDRAVMTIKG
ncbi:MAG TPA: CYTH domain-containing protein, partial [Duganella sp.]